MNPNPLFPLNPRSNSTGAVASRLSVRTTATTVIPSREVGSCSAEVGRLRPVMPDFPNRTALCPLNKAPVLMLSPSTSSGAETNELRLSPLPVSDHDWTKLLASTSVMSSATR